MRYHEKIITGSKKLKTIIVHRKNGAVGSRMTGAGWGGCAVSIVKSGNILPLLTGTRDDYYKPTPARMAKVTESLFATTPGDGAAFYTL